VQQILAERFADEPVALYHNRLAAGRHRENATRRFLRPAGDQRVDHVDRFIFVSNEFRASHKCRSSESLRAPCGRAWAKCGQEFVEFGSRASLRISPDRCRFQSGEHLSGESLNLAPIALSFLVDWGDAERRAARFDK
jgi:hypothetical protein